MTRIIPRDKIEHLLWAPTAGSPDVPITRIPHSTSETTQGIVKDGNFYVFENLEVSPGQYQHIALSTSLLDGGKSKEQPDWWKYVARKKETLHNGIMLYSMMHRLYSLRDDTSMQNVCSEVLSILREDWTKHYPHTGTRLDYKSGLDVVVNHLLPDGNVNSVSTSVPEFERANDNWSYLTLAPALAASALGTTNIIPDDARPFMEALLGSNYADAGAVCQYVSTRKDDGTLREARLWVPTTSNRNASRALVLGVDVSRFGINADDYISDDRPARGVAVREKFP